MVNKRSMPRPENMSIKEASNFWDTHSVADYPSHVVEMEYEPGEHIILFPIQEDLAAQLSEKAREKGISVEMLANLWLRQKLGEGS